MLRPRPLRTGHAGFPRTAAQASPGGLQACRVAGPFRQPPLAMGVHEADRIVVRFAVPFLAGDLVLPDRCPGCLEPRFPFLRALRLTIGVQEQFLAERALPVLLLEQAQGRLAQRERFPASAQVPVIGEGRVVG